MRNYNIILRDKEQKTQPDHQMKLININIFQEKRYCYLIIGRVIEQAKCTYSPLGKAFENQTKTIEGQWTKQFEALKVWKP